MHVDLGAIVANWRAYARLAPGAECAAVVKADAYGLGADRVAPALAAAGARTFFVAQLGEALRLRAALGPGPAVLVLEGLQAAPSLYLEAGLAPVLNSLAEIAAWREAAAGAACAIHVDTGMSRLGVALEDCAAAAALLQPPLAMSHFACAADPAHPLNEIQRGRFLDVAGLFGPARLSLAASAGATLGAHCHFDMIRPGIGLYGDAGLEGPGGPSLAPAFRFEAPILQIRDLKPGDTVGYGATYVAEKRERIATVGVGYADGVLRALSGRGYGVISGRRCALRGRVSMDLATLDVTSVGDAAQVGAMVELIGPWAPLGEMAKLAGTAPYELLTNLRGAERRYGEPAR